MPAASRPGDRDRHAPRRRHCAGSPTTDRPDDRSDAPPRDPRPARYRTTSARGPPAEHPTSATAPSGRSVDPTSGRAGPRRRRRQDEGHEAVRRVEPGASRCRHDRLGRVDRHRSPGAADRHRRADAPSRPRHPEPAARPWPGASSEAGRHRTPSGPAADADHRSAAADHPWAAADHPWADADHQTTTHDPRTEPAAHQTPAGARRQPGAGHRERAYPNSSEGFPNGRPDSSTHPRSDAGRRGRTGATNARQDHVQA